MTFKIKVFKVRQEEGEMEKKKKREKPRVDIVALKKAVAEMMGKTDETDEEEGEKGAYGALRRDRSVETFGEGRKCGCCNCTLAQSNPDNLCLPCGSAIAEWKNFPWNRVEIEKEMAKHCLGYARAKVKRKKARHGVPRDTASGSFTRAVGRREIGEKVRQNRG